METRKSRRLVRNLLLGVVCCAFVATVGGAMTWANETVRIGHFSWPGYGFFHIVDEKNLAPNIDIEFTILEDPYQLFGLMSTGQMEVVTSTVEYGPIAAAEKAPIKLVAYTNISYGTDKIILHPDIKSAADLKGKQVAILEGGLTQIYMGIWLEQNGVMWDEVQMVNLIMNDAAAAMISGQVAGGEFWDPWGTNVLNELEGAQLASQSREPFWLQTALLADSIYMSADFLHNKREVAVDLIRAYYEAVDWWYNNPAEGNQIIADALQFEIEDVELVMGKDDIPEDATLYVYTFIESARFCGVAPGDPPFNQVNGQFYQHWKLTNEWWVKMGLLDEMVPPARGIDCSIVREVYELGYFGEAALNY